MKDIFSVATVYLGEACGIQSEWKHYCTFLNLVLKVKLCEAFRFFCSQEIGWGGCNPTNWQSIARAVLTKPLRWSWWEKIRTNNSLLYHVRNIWKNRNFYSCRHHRGHSPIGHAKMFRELRPWWYGLRISAGVDFIVRGGKQNTTY